MIVSFSTINFNMITTIKTNLSGFPLLKKLQNDYHLHLPETTHEIKDQINISGNGGEVHN